MSARALNGRLFTWSATVIAVTAAAALVLGGPLSGAALTGAAEKTIAELGLTDALRPVFSGREGVLVEICATAEEQERGLEAVAAIEGVLSVSVERGAGRPQSPRFVLTLDAYGNYDVTVSVCSERRSQLLAEQLRSTGVEVPSFAAAINPQVRAEEWLEPLALTLPVLTVIENPYLEANGNRLVIRGAVATQQQREDVLAALRAAVPFAVIDNLVVDQALGEQAETGNDIDAGTGSDTGKAPPGKQGSF